MNHLYRKMLRTGFNLYILIVLVTAMTAFKKVQKKETAFYNENYISFRIYSKC